jgi:hypothetical protein
VSQAIPKVSKLLERVRGEIDGRLRELRPALSEYEQLLVAAEALERSRGQGSRGQGVTPARAAAGAKRAATPARPSSGTASAPVRRGRGSAAGALERAASTVPRGDVREAASKRERAPRGAAAGAIVAALEHGSHTVSELVIVTAMEGPNIRGNLRRLLKERTVTKTKRDGKTAYTLSSSSSSSPSV